MATTVVISRWLKDEAGQDLLEYGLLAVFIAVVAVVAVTAVGIRVQDLFLDFRAGMP